MLFTAQSSRRRKNLVMHSADAPNVFEDDPDDGPAFDLSNDDHDLELQRRFAADCGRPDGLKLAINEEGGQPREHLLPGPFAVIGAEPACNLQIDAPGVGGRQAFLLSLEDRVFACDLAGPVGTRHRGRLITKTWLADSPSLEFGETAVTVADFPGGGDASKPQPGGGRIEYELVFGGGSQSYRAKGEVLLFGGDPRCKLQYRHESVAPVHGAIVSTRTTAWLVDLGTSEGVILDGIAVRLAPLSNGSVLTIGDKEVEVRMLSESQGLISGAAAAAQGGVSEEFVLKVLERYQDSQRNLMDEMRSWTKEFSHVLVEAQHAQARQLQGERQEMRREFVELMRIMAQRLPGPASAERRAAAAMQPSRPDQRLPAPPSQMPAPVVAPTADDQERLTSTSEPEELRRRLEEVEEHLDAHHGWLGSLLRRTPR